MKKIFTFLKKEPMLTVAVTAAAASLIITPPDISLIRSVDWHTLAQLFMMLIILEGFKKEDIFRPVIRAAGRIRTDMGLSFFLVFSVFFASMFVTNDVSLIIFVPLTILLFRIRQQEKYILPVISLENAAAVRGSLLTPFGSPQNLFLYSRSGVTAGNFLLHMAPLCAASAVILAGMIFVLHRRHGRAAELLTGRLRRGSAEKKTEEKKDEASGPSGRVKRILYLIVFIFIIAVIVTRTSLWPFALAAVCIAVLALDRKLFLKVDYVLILTFLCFFIFSSSIAANPVISGFLKKSVAGHEYIWSILLSQVISNVPASIVLWPFTENLTALLYGLDTAGLVSVIGSLASVINYRIYVREYPENGRGFLRVFTILSLIIFAIVAVPQYFLCSWRF